MKTRENLIKTKFCIKIVHEEVFGTLISNALTTYTVAYFCLNITVTLAPQPFSDLL
jgi:hypothetical protein